MTQGRELILDTESVAAPAPTKPRKRKPIKTWLNLVAGQLYNWSERKQKWIPTGRYPHGGDPMGLINGS